MLAAATAVATATFTLADALLWRALPYRDAQQLAMLVTTHASGEQAVSAVSLPDFTLLPRGGATGGWMGGDHYRSPLG
jgi:hypothetical protein